MASWSSEVYDAEWAAGVAILRPLLSVDEAQHVVNCVLRKKWWKKLSAIRKVTVSYRSSWEHMSSAEDHRTRGEILLTMGNLCEGTVYHEMAHMCYGDSDNSHAAPFVRAHLAILDHCLNSPSLVHRYRMELAIRGVPGTI